MRMVAQALHYSVAELMGETQNVGVEMTAEERRLLGDYRRLNEAGRAAVAQFFAVVLGNPAMQEDAPVGAAVS